MAASRRRPPSEIPSVFKPVRMCRLEVLVLKKHLDAITSALGSCGYVHLSDAVTKSRKHLLKPVGDERGRQALQSSLELCETLLDTCGCDKTAVPPENAELQSMTAKDIRHQLEAIQAEHRAYGDKLQELTAKAADIAEESRMLAEFPLQTTNLETLQGLAHFHVLAGSLPTNAFAQATQALDGQAILLRGNPPSDKILVLAAKRNRWAVEEALSKFGFEKQDTPELQGAATVTDRRQQLDKARETLEQELDATRRDLLSLGEKHGPTLLAARMRLQQELAVQEAQAHFGSSRYLYCVSGWIPAAQGEAVKQLVAEATESTGLVVLTAAEDDKQVCAGAEEVPVKLGDSPLVRPFQLLVGNFSMPNYHELDPSLFVGLTFMLLFGYMFGDVGQGAVLALVGLCLKFSRRQISEQWRDAGGLLIYCGLSAMVFGFLYGSVFGYEHLLPALWLHPLRQQDITKLLLTAISVGVIFLSSAVVANIFNHLLNRRYFEACFDKVGVLGLAFYWGALLTAILAKANGFQLWTLVLPLVPLLLVFLREIIHNVIFHHNLLNGESAFTVAVESAVETMETLTGYLSGTLSFIRVGAFAISHAALCLAVYAILGALGKFPGSGLLALVVIFFGNAIIIALEGMVAGIQCLRLEYYELFSRFFQGGGIAFRPLSLKTQHDSSSHST